MAELRGSNLIIKEWTSMNIKYITSGVLTIIVAGIAVIVLAVGGGSAKTGPQQTPPAGSAVSIRTTSLGKTLVDANGRTLYLFHAELRVLRPSDGG
jgi:hypothetical protein